MKKVSVIIPSYNHALYIEQTIRSICTQDYDNLELLVIDDGSKDSSPELIQKLAQELKFRFILKSNEGLCATLNRGIKETSGEYLIFIASDDTITPHRIREQVSYLEKNLLVDVVSGGANFIDNIGNILFTKKPKKNTSPTFESIIKRNYILAATCMFRRSVFERFGTYDTKYVFEDYYMWLKLLKSGGQMFITDKVWANYRFMSGDSSKRIRWYYEGLKQILSDYLPDPRVKKRLRNARLVFFIKLSLVEGRKSILDMIDEFQLLGASQRLIVRSITTLPTKLRLKIYKHLVSRV